MLKSRATYPTQQVWDARPVLDRALAALDPATLVIHDPAAVPCCPHCGGRVVMNVRGGDWYIETPSLEGGRRFAAWLKQCRTAGKRLVVVEVGAGFNTPGVIRGRNEAIVAATAGA